jgi:hypothetical protein
MRIEAFTEVGNPGGRRRSPERRGLSAFLLSVGALLWLSACFEGESHGGKVAGGGTGSEAGDAYGRLRGDSTLGGALARITLYRSADSLHPAPEAVAAVTADTLGNYRFPAPEAGSYDLEFRGNACECGNRDFGRGLVYRRMVRIGSRGHTDLGSDSLTPSLRLSGKLDRIHAGRRVRLALTPYTAAVDSAGSFLFPAVPRGQYDLMLDETAAAPARTLGAVTLEAGIDAERDYRTLPDTVPADTTKVPVDTTKVPVDTTKVTPVDTTKPLLPPTWVWVDDFSDIGLVSLLGRTYGGGRWTVTPTGRTPLTYLPDTAGAYSGRSLHVTFLPDPSKPVTADTGHVRATLPLGSGTPDLSRTDTLAIKARGKGELDLTLYWNTQSGEASFTYTLVLGGSWKEYRQFTRVMEKSGLRLTTMVRMEISARSGTEYWLDDIRLFSGSATPSP